MNSLSAREAGSCQRRPPGFNWARNDCGARQRWVLIVRRFEDTPSSPDDKSGDSMNRTLATAVAASLLVLGTAGPVSADPPDSANCLGVVTQQRAIAHHDIGEHASSQEEPRLGLGNVTREILGEDAHVGEFGSFLGDI